MFPESKENQPATAHCWRNGEAGSWFLEINLYLLIYAFLLILLFGLCALLSEVWSYSLPPSPNKLTIVH